MKSILLLCGALCLSLTRGEAVELRVEAGEVERLNSIVRFEPPQGWEPGAIILQDRSGAKLDGQIGDGREGFFVLPRLQRGKSAEYTIRRASGAKSNMVAESRNGRVNVTASGKPVFSFQAEPGEFPRDGIKPIYKRGAYLHPVYTPGGNVITDDFPANHLHHHGIWFAWTKTVFEGRAPDFWNMGDAKGRVDFAKLKGAWSGPVTAGFASTEKYVDMTSGVEKIALNEDWKVDVFPAMTNRAGGVAFLYDLECSQRCAGEAALQLPKYYYGGLGFRGHWDWNGAANTFFLTSNGETNRVAGNETRARWCYIGGKVNGRQSGVAILCSPANFRAPQPVRLHPTEPFFCYAPSEAGDWEIKPGESYVSRYRFVAFDGPPEQKELEALWEDYAKPPRVKVTP